MLGTDLFSFSQKYMKKQAHPTSIALASNSLTPAKTHKTDPIQSQSNQKINKIQKIKSIFSGRLLLPSGWWENCNHCCCILHIHVEDSCVLRFYAIFYRRETMLTQFVLNQPFVMSSRAATHNSPLSCDNSDNASI